MKLDWKLSLRVLLWSAVLAGGGCGQKDLGPVTAETDEPLYVEGKRLLKQGRTPEALAAFLKVIEKRGEQSSAESHLDAGIIYLKESKDPVEAYHHFRQYLALQPNSKLAPYVRELIDNARREFARSLPAQSLENLAPGDYDERLTRLQRENDELRAKLESYRGDAPLRVPHTTLAPVGPPPAPTRAPAPAPAEIPGPIEVAPLEAGSPISPAPAGAAEAPALGSGPALPAPRQAPTPTPARAVPPTRPTAPAAAAGGGGAAARRHHVAAGDTLFNLTKRYYGAASTAKARAIFEANRDVMKSEGDLHPGMDLRIP